MTFEYTVFCAMRLVCDTEACAYTSGSGLRLNASAVVVDNVGGHKAQYSRFGTNGMHKS